MDGDKKIDEGWKEKARADNAPPPKSLPADFSALVSSLAASAMMALEGEAKEGGAPAPPDLDRAKFAIDLLGVLEEKTRGNLDAAEARHLSALLHSVRLAFVAATRTPPAK